jgi:hypothetical protein
VYVTDSSGTTTLVGPGLTAADVTNAADTSSDDVQEFTGFVETPVLISSGYAGATYGLDGTNRFLGATSSGPPSGYPISGWLEGDWCLDLTGAIWMCTTAGKPGTWTNLTSAANIGLGSAAMIQSSTTQAVTAATFTPITMPSTVWDYSSGDAMTATASRLTAPVAGLYLATGWIEYQEATEVALEANIRWNGATYDQPEEEPGVSTSQTTGQATAMMKLAAGGYAELVGWSSAAVTVHYGALQMARIG